MSDETALLEQVATEIVRDFLAGHGAEADAGWAPALWATLDAAGLPLVGIPEASGGAGGDWPEVAAVVRALGRYAAPVPLAETCALAGWLLAGAGLPIPSGPLAVAPVGFGERLEIERTADGWRLRGQAARVPWASEATAVAVLATSNDGYAVALVPRDRCQIERGTNLAGEPRDRVTFEDVPLDRGAVGPVALHPDDLLARGALVRSVQIVAALERLLAMTVEYVSVRTQFGRSLGRFQAVQHDLARLAGEVEASRATVDAALHAATRGADSLADSGGAGLLVATGDAGLLELAAAKVRAGEAATVGARIAHQLHGAIGVTQEHALHRLTTRLWSWRDEFGGERVWATRLGLAVAASGPDGFWAWFTGTHPSTGTRM